MTVSPTVVLVGGPSGVGKSKLAQSLAQTLTHALPQTGKISIVETDDLFDAILQRTSVDTHPELHFFTNVTRQPETSALSAEATLEHFLSLSEVLTPFIREEIDSLLDSGVTVIIEGDHLLPALAADYAQELASVFLIEPDLSQIVSNYSKREPDAGLQTRRAEVSLLHGEWLKSQCDQLNLCALPVRPWDDQVQRVMERLSLI